jgi:Flp pilus assembly protein TadD
LLDPNINPIPAIERMPATFSSEKFGYSIDLKNTLWNRRWATLAQEVPFAEYGVLTARSTAAFCVIPVWIGDDDLAVETIATALTARIGVPFPDDSIFAMRNIHQGPVRGRAFAWERKQDDANLLYRIRVLRGRSYAYLLATWMNKKSEASSDFLDLAMDCVSFPEKVERDPLLTGDQLRTTHSLVWNDIGIALLRDKNVAAALPWFKRAYEIEPTNLVPLANYADTLVKTGHAADALAAIDHYAAEDARPALRRVRAQVLNASGKHDEAIRSLLELRKAAPEDKDTDVILIDLYLAVQRYADAIAECDRFTAASGELVGILQRKGIAQGSLKHFAEAKITLEKALAKEPGNAEVKKLLEQLAALSTAPAK